MNNVLQTGAMSMFVGAIYGGFIQSRVAYMDFIKNNQATSFQNHWDAKVVCDASIKGVWVFFYFLFHYRNSFKLECRWHSLKAQSNGVGD